MKNLYESILSDMEEVIADGDNKITKQLELEIDKIKKSLLNINSKRNDGWRKETMSNYAKGRITMIFSQFNCKNLIKYLNIDNDEIQKCFNKGVQLDLLRLNVSSDSAENFWDIYISIRTAFIGYNICRLKVPKSKYKTLVDVGKKYLLKEVFKDFNTFANTVKDNYYF